MKTWSVCVAIAASQTIEGIKANSEAEAIEKAMGMVTASLCYQCSQDLTLGDPLEDESTAWETPAE